MMSTFKLVSDYKPAGDQPRAIEQLADGLNRGDRHQVLLGVTGSGKTFTIASVINQVQRPALVIAHNKTLAGQLYSEFLEFFPDSAVAFFVSYYDYYQPEAYVPSSDTYIEKDSSVNDEIDRMRHVATHSLLTRRDVIIVASVSCIFGLGPVEYYGEMKVNLKRGESPGRDAILRRLVEIQYSRNDLDFHRGTFRVRGDVVDIFPIYEEDRALRVSFWGDEIEKIHFMDPLRGIRLESLDEIEVYPGSHYVTGQDVILRARLSIREELAERLQEFRQAGRELEAQRLEQRTMYDLEMLEEMGYCNGVENYSRHLSGRLPGEPSPTLIDYLPHDALIVIDESHQTVPQIKGMVRGDQSRKQTLVDFGFRLPSALDNRPLSYEEFDARVGQRIYVSATPTPFEVDLAKGVVVEQIIRPTGLVDPEVQLQPAASQVDDVLAEIRDTVAAGHRVLVTTLTKRMAEDLTDYLSEHNVKVRYLHSDVDTLQRLEIVRDLRAGSFDVLVGINLLREGLDIPEVALVAILDADREGFLRSETALIQTTGRASRNIDGRVIFYIDKQTKAVKQAIKETRRRRQIQERYNTEHNITPRSVMKSIRAVPQLDAPKSRLKGKQLGLTELPLGNKKDLAETIERLTADMFAAAESLEFEQAAKIRDRIQELKKMHLRFG
ncbi:MAG: excinuclease ABC subunit UvrB [Deltaproteobacteria bacterium]|nr:excinuclease ABC subunit UvrB [Deltaproteobacteria bacterium]